MPPKPFIYKAPDGKQFESKSEYRDYMMSTFFSYKNVKDAPSPLIKAPGDVDGQVFEIADCENSTLVIMDNTEQVQIDNVKKCRIFIGACASSIFIRNCEDCVFYTCCRQLRLREVTNSTLYVYSMAEVHIEYSNSLKFAPFNGGYPEQRTHLDKVGLDINHNLWYDIFDHNDPAKTRANWSLLPENEYEEPWFPAAAAAASSGGACDVAVPITKAGSVVRADAEDAGQVGQAFGVDQMIADSKKSENASNSNSPAKSPAKASSPSSSSSSSSSPVPESKKAAAAKSQPVSPSPSHTSPSPSKGESKGGSGNGSGSKKSKGSAAEKQSKAATSKPTASVLPPTPPPAPTPAPAPAAIVEPVSPPQPATTTAIATATATAIPAELEAVNTIENTFKSKSLIKKDLKKMTIEIALLTATAIGKGVDISLWLSVSINGGKIPVADFNDKLRTLALSVGMGQDWDTKRELEMATSTSSLDLIYKLCGCVDPSSSSSSSSLSDGNQLVDVAYFLYLCDEKVKEIMNDVNEGEFGIEKDDDIEEDNDDDDEDDDDDEKAEEILSSEGNAHEILEVILESVTANSRRPHSAPAGSRRPGASASSNTTTKAAAAAAAAEMPANIITPTEEFTETFLPGSPYDEEVAFNLEYEEDIDSTVLRRNRDDGKVNGKHPPVPRQRRSANQLFPSSQTQQKQPASPTLKQRGRPSTAPKSSSSTGAGAVAPATATSRTTVRSSSAKQTSVSTKPSLSQPSSPLATKGGATGVLRPRPSSADPRQAASAARSSSAPSNRKMSSSVAASTMLPGRRSYGSARSTDATLGGTFSVNTPITITARSMTTEVQLANLEEVVEGLVRNTVRQTDFYHSIQVHLGFIEEYTMVLPRGLAVVSTPRTWLTVKDLQTAFNAGRLRLSETQVRALMRLVTAFVKNEKDYDSVDNVGASSSSSSSSSSAESSLGGGPQGDTAMATVHNDKLNALHFRKYLVYLRITTAKNMRAASTGRAMGITMNNISDGAGGDTRKSWGGVRKSNTANPAESTEPIAWEDWLGKKIIASKRTQSAKPKDFRRAIAGQSHNLKKEEVEEMLQKHEIIPETMIDIEISLRVKSWVLDTQGRRDFSHVLNVEVKRWQKLNDNVDWGRLHADKRNEVIADLKQNMMTQRADKLRESENKKATITKELYWKFDHDCREKKYMGTSTIIDWVKQTQHKLEKDIEKFLKDIHDREKAAVNKAIRRKTVAPLCEIERKLTEAASNMKNDQGIELRKSLVALRKDARAVGINNGSLVSKEVFDKHMEAVLAPRIMQLPSDIRQIAIELRKSHEGIPSAAASAAFDKLKGKKHAGSGSSSGSSKSKSKAVSLSSAPSPVPASESDDLFLSDKKEAIRRLIALDNITSSRKKAGFKEWKEKKLKEKEDKEKKEKETAKKIEQDKQRKEKKAKIVFRKWLKLRNENKYSSKIYGSQVLPQPLKATHPTRWLKDVDYPLNQN